MDVRFKADASDTIQQLTGLTPRQFMIAWTTKVKQFVEQRAREKIGGDFGHRIASGSIQVDDSNPDRHTIYVGGENGYIAEHIHTGGTIRPRERQYLAIPIDRSVKGIYPREYAGDLVLIRKKEDGPRGRAYLAKPMKRKIKPLFVLKKSVTQRPRPWWPEEWEVRAVTEDFIRENFT